MATTDQADPMPVPVLSLESLLRDYPPYVMCPIGRPRCFCVAARALEIAASFLNCQRAGRISRFPRPEADPPHTP